MRLLRSDTSRAATGMVAAFFVACGAGCGFERESERDGASGGEALLERYEFSEAHMGTEFRLVFFAPDSGTAASAAAAAFAKLARLDSLFSDYRADSEIAFVAAAAELGEPYEASDELLEILSCALDWAERTGGAFDPTIGPATQLWRWSARRGELPDSARLGEAVGLVGYEDLRVDMAEGVIEMRKGMALDLGGIAKGYAGDVMLALLAAQGMTAAMVDAGGDIVANAPPPGSDGWHVVLPDGQRLRLAHQAVATSGDTFRYFEVDGVRYSHIVDPRTGVGAQDTRAVTVLAPDGTSADVLASALTIMDARDGDALVASLDGTRRIALQGTQR